MEHFAVQVCKRSYEFDVAGNPSPKLGNIVTSLSMCTPHIWSGHMAHSVKCAKYPVVP
jgi:hypothetical protein